MKKVKLTYLLLLKELYTTDSSKLRLMEFMKLQDQILLLQSELKIQLL